MSRKKTRDPLTVARDAFVIDLLRTAREHGIAEERERVIAWLRDPEVVEWVCSSRGSVSGLAIEIGQGAHDAGRTFPTAGKAETHVNNAARMPQETQCQSHSTKVGAPLPDSSSRTTATTPSSVSVTRK